MNSIVRDSCRSILVEVATFFARYGVSHRELQDILKESVVESEIRASGGVTKRISALAISEKTGISRKFISRYRAQRKANLQSSVRTESSVPTGLLLKIWHNDPTFLDEEGRPAVLRMADNGSRSSFPDLVRAAEDPREPSVVFQELLNNGAVESSGKDSVKVVARTLIMGAHDESIVKYFGIASSNLLSTLVHNTGRSEGEIPHFERTTWVSGISKETLRRFSELVSETSVPFLELLDDWLNARQVRDQDITEDKSALGVGIYVFDRTSE